MIRRALRILAFAAIVVAALAALLFSPSVAECTFVTAEEDAAPRLDLLLPPVGPSQVRFALVKTGHVTTAEALTYSCGSPLRQVGMNHTAVLIEHPQGSILFDTGLGRNVDAQFAEDMPSWAAPLFAFEKDTPARDQLAAAGIAPPRLIVLSHAHWDHASAIEDFPDAEILVSAPEKTFLATARPPAVLPSQVSSPAIRWRNLSFEEKPFAGFAQSVDLFGDGTVVLVPLYGHTPGSVGLFLTIASGKRFFFIGDTVWRKAALFAARPKFWLMGAIVDNDADATAATIRDIRAVMRVNPGLVVLPAHDAEAQNEIGYFPHWQQ